MSIGAAKTANASTTLLPHSTESHGVDVQCNPNPELFIHRPSTKRKRDCDGFGDTFQFQAHPSTSSNTQLSLIPRVVIPRSRLPLAFLDPCDRLQDTPGHQFFSANVVALEASSQHVDQPTVLIAEPSTGNSLYAVERVQGEVYALCKLAAWVTLQILDSASTKNPSSCRPSQNGPLEQEAPFSRDWWRVAAIQQGPQDYSPLGKKRRPPSARRFRLCLKAPSSEIAPQSTTCAELPTENVRHTASPSIETDRDVSNSQPTLSPQSPADVLKTISIQYYEALYVSKTSLAYFVKGPLSRARVMLQDDIDSPGTSLSLVQYLRSMILSLPLMDKKYRESLPEIIKDVPIGEFSEDENGPLTAPLKKKTRKPKKESIGKNGLSPDEGEKIARWWSHESMLGIGDGGQKAREESSKARILEQKARETQLQMILILEILALEALSAKVPPAENLIQAVVAIEGDVESSKTRKSKPKKPQNLLSLLDMSIDRLSIWLSISQEDVKTSDDSVKQPTQQSGRSNKRETRNDILREFCTDVILPLYGARVPELCATICRKLGGPQIASRNRPPLLKAARSSQAMIKPGATIQRPPIAKPRRTLEHVLTDDKRASQRPSPSLTRSATDSILPSLKRERSEMPLSSISVNKAGIEKSKRYSQREVDLKAVSRDTQAKLKKKMSAEQELKGAIAALRKPNPRMAVKDLIESAEKRLAGTASQSRKPKNPVRNPFAQGIQVMATPKGNRQKDVFALDPSRLVQAFPAVISHAEPDPVPPSSGLRVPSSSSKPQVQPGMDLGLLRTAKCKLPSVQQTPTRRMPNLTRSISQTTCRSVEAIAFPRSGLKLADGNKESNVPDRDSSPELPAYSAISCGTTSTTRTTAVDQSYGSAIQESPAKTAGTRKVFTQPTYSPPEVHRDSRSIYESLGWDDDIDELM